MTNDTSVAPTTDLDGDSAPPDTELSDASLAGADVQDSALAAVELSRHDAGSEDGPAPSGPIEFREPGSEGGQQ